MYIIVPVDSVPEQGDQVNKQIQVIFWKITSFSVWTCNYPLKLWTL